MKPEVNDALVRYLLSVADDEIVLGYRDSEWTGIAPLVEEDIAFSSLAQDEIGHARLFYQLVAELAGGDEDSWGLGRAKDAYYHARLLEHRATPKYREDSEHEAGGDWAFAVARRFLYDQFDDLRTHMLLGSSHTPLAEALKKVRREEHYHLKHGEIWWRTLSHTEDARRRLKAALEHYWPDFLGLFEAVPGEGVLHREGLLPTLTTELKDAWMTRVRSLAEEATLELPHAEASLGGRQGQHGSAWDELYTDMTMVRALEPKGSW